MREILKVSNIVKRFGDVEVLRGVSISVSQSSIVSLLGPNGSGKTTLIRIIAGILRPSSGEIVFRGRLASFLPQEHGLFEELSGWDNIMFYARLYGLRDDYAKRRGKDLLERLGIIGHANDPVAKYSGGMKKKLSLVIALLPDADLLIFDEPTTGLDPLSRQVVWELVEEEKRNGRAVLLTTHYMEEAEKLSDYIYLIYKGSIVAEGSSEDLKKRYAPESVVEIELYKDISRAVEILREEGFKSFVENDIVKIFSENPREDVPKIITILYSKDVYVKSLKVAEPTLEDVFIKLTGRRLSEE